MEELGWRGYAEDSIAQYHTWFTESIIFGFLWAGWHIPLFFIEGTYQANILAMNPLYMINFFLLIGYFAHGDSTGHIAVIAVHECTVIHCDKVTAFYGVAVGYAVRH